MKTVLKKGIIASSLMMLSIGTAMAASATGNFQATSNVQGFCSVTATNIAFGEYTGAQKDVNGSFTALCSKGISYVVTISPGQSGNVLNRRLKGATAENADELVYQLFTNSSHSNVWAAQEGQAGSNAMGFTGVGENDTRTIYGRINAGNQYILPDSYSDTLILTVTY